MDELKKLSERLKDASGASLLDQVMKQAEGLQSIEHAMKGIASLNLPITEIQPPRFDPTLLKLPTQQEVNNYQSAGVLMKRLANTISAWRDQLPDGLQPAVLALLNGGVRINVTTLAQESFHGIRIEGTLDAIPCIVLAHQNTVQLLCYAEPVSPPEKPRRKIGFIIDGKASEA